jgi:hypothetical protein
MKKKFFVLRRFTSFRAVVNTEEVTMQISARLQQNLFIWIAQLFITFRLHEF